MLLPCLRRQALSSPKKPRLEYKKSEIFQEKAPLFCGIMEVRKPAHTPQRKGAPSMKNYSREAGIAKAGLLRFCKRISKGMGRPAEKLVTDMLYGLSIANKCHLTEIARALGEEITIKKTVDRLSRGLQKFEGRAIAQENYLKQAGKYIDETTIYPIDESDLAKPYSVAMEALHEVRDGSTNQIVPGYLTLEIAALTHKTKIPLPLYERVYSAAEDGFKSQDDEVLKGLRFLSERFGHGGIRVMDRGYDGNVYIQYFTKEAERFIIRVKKNRIVHYNGKSVNIAELAKRYKGKCALKCTLHEETIHCKVTEIPVQLPAFGKQTFYLVIVYGFGKEPMLLLTNCRSNDQRFCLAIVKMYLLRWRIEDQFRFKKQQYGFEDFRVRSLHAIRTLHQLVTLLTGYLALLSQEPTTMVSCVLRQAACPIPRSKKRKPKQFFHYELAAGFAVLLRKTTANLKALFPPVRTRPPVAQISFFSYNHWLRLADTGASLA
jgi:predicted secreted protein